MATSPAVTGAFWDIANPLKPKGIIDPDSTLDIPFDWSDWLTDIEDTIASHSILPDEPMTCLSSAEDAGVVTAFVRVNGAEVGQTLAVTCRIVTAAGRTDDRSVYLKIKDR